MLSSIAIQYCYAIMIMIIIYKVSLGRTQTIYCCLQKICQELGMKEDGIDKFLLTLAVKEHDRERQKSVGDKTSSRTEF